MRAITVREAKAADIAEVRQLTSQDVGQFYRSQELLGGGAPLASDQLTLVAADSEGSICGVIGVGPPPIGTIDVALKRARGAFNARKVPWWKINVLAVHQIHRGEGIGRELLRQAVQRMPRRHVGLYGDIEETLNDSVTWFRRQGFYIGPPSGLTPRERPGDRDGIGLIATPGLVPFRGYRSILKEHLENRAHPKWEERTARAEYARLVKLYSTGREAALELGYRLYMRSISDNRSSDSCLHASMGPRPMFVFAWDPTHKRVCFHCIDEHLRRIEKYDAEQLCDGCGNEHADVRMSFVGDDDRMLLIAVGLCTACRSGCI